MNQKTAKLLYRYARYSTTNDKDRRQCYKDGQLHWITLGDKEKFAERQHLKAFIEHKRAKERLVIQKGGLVQSMGQSR